MKKIIYLCLIFVVLYLPACQKGIQKGGAKEVGNIEEITPEPTITNAPEITITPTTQPHQPTTTPASAPEPSGTPMAGRSDENMEQKEVKAYIGPKVPGVTAEMQQATFWLEQLSSSEEVIYTKAEIQQYNTRHFNSLPFLLKPEETPDTISGKEVAGWIKQYTTPSQSIRYDENRKQYNDEDYTKLAGNINLEGIPDKVPVQFGITVKRTQMRTWPSWKMSFSNPDSQQIDYFTETAVYAAEPVVIYHTSSDGKWFFAGIYHYRAWIPVQDVALCTREELKAFQDHQERLLVRAPVLLTPASDDNRVSKMQLDMGVSLPIQERKTNEYLVKYPVRSENGTLEYQTVSIPETEAVADKIPDYTTANILNQAFQVLGETYGWGGMNNARDCTSFLQDVYRTVGIHLPRNSNQQEQMEGAISLKGKTREERLSIIDRLQPGSTLYMPGHAMMYVGKWQGRHYILHDVTTVYFKGQGGSLEPVALNRAALTPLDVCTGKGSEYIMLLNTVVSFH